MEELDDEIRSVIVNNMHELNIRLQVIGAADPGATLRSTNNNEQQQEGEITFQDMLPQKAP